MKFNAQTLDVIASISSLICAIHCAALPILLSFSSLSSLQFLENPYIEWSFILAGLVFVFVSLWPSYTKIHHQTKPLLFAAIGFGFIAIGRLDFTELWEVCNTVFGATLVSLAHYFNWKLLKGQKVHQH